MARFGYIVAALGLGALTTLDAARGQPVWDGAAPGPHVGGGMAYDSNRGVAVRFGGAVDYQVYSGETWERNGTQWVQRRIPGPSARSGIGSGMTYDSRRAVVVLFGGGPPDVYLGDTWEYDGVAWTQRMVAGPPARRYPAMAFDSRRGVTVLFGGRSQFASDAGTWEWDGTSWALRATTGPTARFSPAAAYDPVRGVTVLFGGQYAPADTWEWDGNSWTLRASAGPLPRMDHSMAYDPQRQAVVLTGGRPLEVATPYNDTWEWDGIAWTIQPSGAMPPVCYQNAVYDASRSAVLLSGGTSEANLSMYRDHVWDRHGDEWSEPAAHPPAGYTVAMAYDPWRQTTVLFAGNSPTACPGETWEYAAGAWTRRQTTTPSPAGRKGHAMVYDSERRVTLLSGGAHCSAVFGSSDLWAWNGAAWSLLSQAGPPERAWHGIAYDSFRQVVVVFGGQRGGLYYGDTWEWDGNGWTQRSTTGPSMRTGAAMVYDPDRRVTVLYGGTDTQSTPPDVGDTWEWDGAVWTRRSISGPPKASHCSLLFDPERRRVVLCTHTTPTVQTWEWDGTVWTQREATGPPGGNGARAVFDPDGRRILRYGGDSYWTLSGNRTWFFRESCAPVFSSHPQQRIVPPGGHAAFSASVAGAQSVRWRKGGVPLEDGPRISGATTQTLTIDPVEPGDEGFYCLAATSECSTLVSGAASLRLDCYPNCDGSTTPPNINISDFICFINRYSQEDPWANCDGSTTAPVLNVADFTCFLSAFAAGCP